MHADEMYMLHAFTWESACSLHLSIVRRVTVLEVSNIRLTYLNKSMIERSNFTFLIVYRFHFDQYQIESCYLFGSIILIALNLSIKIVILSVQVHSFSMNTKLTVNDYNDWVYMYKFFISFYYCSGLEFFFFVFFQN